MTQVAQATHNPEIFEAPTLRAAKDIILTAEDSTTDDRWMRETPYLAQLAVQKLEPTMDSLVVDFGCGVGRIAKELVWITHCQVLGVDASAAMRGHAHGYVASERFACVSNELFQEMLLHGLRCDMAIAVWALQHTVNPRREIEILADMLVPGGKLLVVNANHRCVPTIEHGWANDGEDISLILKEYMSEVSRGTLDDRFVTPSVAKSSWWGVFRK